MPENAGLSYVHGGFSTQEMLVSLVQNITNPITSLDFIQFDTVSHI
mgnify:CR=1